MGKFSTWHESCEAGIAFYEDHHITVVKWTAFPKSKNILGTVSKSVIALVVSGTGVLAAQAERSATHAAGQVVLAAAPSVLEHSLVSSGSTWCILAALPSADQWCAARIQGADQPTRRQWLPSS